MTETVERKDLDFPGHLMVRDRCRWFKHSHIGGPNGFCISSIGEWYPKWKRKPEEIGSDRLYETFVFRLVNEDCQPSEIDSVGSNSREAAEHIHELMLVKYSDKVAEG